jgi:hypothetical protein
MQRGIGAAGKINGEVSVNPEKARLDEVIQNGKPCGVGALT